MDMETVTPSRIMQVVEQNVDGCGGQAEEYVECSCDITEEIADRFSDLLREEKENIENADFSTGEYVEAAIEHFNVSADECPSPGAPRLSARAFLYRTTVYF